MREYRVIAVLTGLLFLVVVAYFFRHALLPGPGELDEVAAGRIAQTCNYREECKVRAGDLFDGEWDTFWEFGPGVSQAEVDAAVGVGKVRVKRGRRLVVLAGGGKVRKLAYEPYGKSPVEHQVVFMDDGGNERRVVRLGRQSWEWAKARPVGGRVYYTLRPEDR